MTSDVLCWNSRGATSEGGIVASSLVRSKLSFRMRVEIRAVAFERKHDEEFGVHAWRWNVFGGEALNGRVKGRSQLHESISTRTHRTRDKLRPEILCARADAPNSVEDDKGMAAFRAKTKYREVVIKRRSALDPKATHHRETRAINQREILIAIR